MWNDLWKSIRADPGSFYIIVFIAGVLALLVLLAIFGFVSEARDRAKERRRLEDEKRQKDEAEEQRAREEADKQVEQWKRAVEQDKRFCLIVHCPPCLGTGQAWRTPEGRISWPGVDYCRSWRSREKWSVHDVIYTEKLGSGKSEAHRCPYCNGRGIAVAYFDRQRKICCDKCKGSGTFVVVTRGRGEWELGEHIPKIS
jgi:hypothetical protein